MPRGGKRLGAGRPLEAGEFRKQRQLRATENEWEIIRAFSQILKHTNPTAAKKFVEKFKTQD